MQRKENIKVAYIIHNPSYYGSNKALLNILEEVIEKKWIRPIIIMGKYGHVLCKEFDYRKIPYKIISHRLSIYPPLNNYRDFFIFFPRLFYTIFQNYIAVYKIKKVVHAFGAELIHTNISPDNLGARVAKRIGIPHIRHIREYLDLYYNHKPMYSNISFLRRLKKDYSIAITNGIKKHYGLTNKSRVIYDGVHKSSYKYFNPKKKKYFLFAGRLEEAKGISHLLNVFVKFVENGNEYSLLIAGDGKKEYVDRLNKFVVENGLLKKVQFLGFRSDLNELMAEATAIIVPSKYEGFGLITVEAMFNGCLIIGRNSGGTKEILEKEGLGLLYNSEDELLELMKNVVKREIESFFPIIKTAQNRAASLYSLEQNALLIYKFYNEILENNN